MLPWRNARNARKKVTLIAAVIVRLESKRAPPHALSVPSLNKPAQNNPAPNSPAPDERAVREGEENWDRVKGY